MRDQDITANTIYLRPDDLIELISDASISLTKDIKNSVSKLVMYNSPSKFYSTLLHSETNLVPVQPLPDLDLISGYIAETFPNVESVEISLLSKFKPSSNCVAFSPSKFTQILTMPTSKYLL